MKNLFVSVVAVLVLFQANIALANGSCKSLIAVAQSYYETGEQLLELGLLNYEKAFESSRQGDHVQGCVYLDVAKEDLEESVRSLYLSVSEFSNASALCTSQADKNNAKTMIGYAQQLVTESTYYDELVTSELEYSCAK